MVSFIFLPLRFCLEVSAAAAACDDSAAAAAAVILIISRPCRCWEEDSEEPSSVSRHADSNCICIISVAFDGIGFLRDGAWKRQIFFIRLSKKV